MAGCDCQVEVKDREQARVLWWLLAINGLMFLVEFALGLWADSTALIADALDMLADASVYGIGLYAVGRATTVKVHAARLSGWMQILLGLGVFAEVLRRLLFGSEPDPGYMVIVGFVALVANFICVLLIAKQRNGEVHMRASWIFTKNDLIANLGVILAGGLVYWLGSNWPDLVIGSLVSLLVVRGGVMILKEARAESQNSCSQGRCD